MDREFCLKAADGAAVKLLLIDGFYYAYRSFFAIRDLTNSRGEPTNAVYGFIKAVRRMIKDLEPDLAAAVWDMGIPKRRLELQPAYKEQRAEMPDLMRPQIGRIQEILPLLGVQCVGLPATEADDLMASYATAARNRSDTVVLATNDKDLFQLVDERVKVYSTAKTDLAAPKDTHALLGPETVRAKWGVEPVQIAEVLSLVGDTSDNIPGVNGLGPKGAAALLRAHGSLDALLAAPEIIKNERVREKIQGARAQIVSNREMVRLDLDLELPVELDALRIRPQYPELLAALADCEFKTLSAEIQAEAVRAESGRQGELF
jgi:5'-3' exonuclease